MEDKRDKIIQVARKLFAQYGIKNVRMDEIAVEAGVSKKTIYQLFKDKAELIKQVMLSEIVLFKKAIIEVVENKEINPIDKNIRINDLIIKIYKNYPVQVERDLQRFYPSILEEIREHMMNKMFTSIVDNLKLGIELGYYRQDINPEIIAGLQMSRSELIRNKDNNPYLSNFSYEQILKELLKYHLYGIVSEKGRQYLKTINFDEV